MLKKHSRNELKTFMNGQNEKHLHQFQTLKFYSVEGYCYIGNPTTL